MIGQKKLGGEMDQTKPVKFVRIYHRWSGIGLILVLTIKTLSGLGAAGRIGMIPASLVRLHFSEWVDVPMFFLLLSHALYGLFKIFQTRVTNKVVFFWWTNIIGLILFFLSIVFIYII